MYTSPKTYYSIVYIVYSCSLGEALARKLRPQEQQQQQQHQTRFVLEGHHGGPEQSIRVIEEVGQVIQSQCTNVTVFFG